MRILVVAVLLVTAAIMSGCAANDGKVKSEPTEDSKGSALPRVSQAAPVYGYSSNQADLLAPEFPRVVEVVLPGAIGAEPNIGVTSQKGIFITAFDGTWRSLDGAKTWKKVYEFSAPVAGGMEDTFETADPYLWADPDTDRVFTNHMFPVLTCSSNIFSDDNGETWTHAPMSCGLPVVDHQKLSTAKPAIIPSPPAPAYPNLVYYCYNKLLATNCAVSYNGGISFQYDTVVADFTECGGINGQLIGAPDGTVVVPHGFNCGIPRVSVSADNGLTWETRVFGEDIAATAEGTIMDIDPEVAFTPDGTAYYYTRGGDGAGYLYRTKDNFATVDGPFKVSPPEVKGVIHAGLVAGADGRIAVAYLGNREFDGDPSAAPDATRWHLYTTFSYNAASGTPTFQTQQVTPDTDPIQIGCIWLGGGGGGPKQCRNLLDFIDAAVDKEGRFYVGLTDGCVAKRKCPNNPSAKITDSHERAIAVAIQDHGPSLTDPAKLLPSLGYTEQVYDLNVKPFAPAQA